MYIIKMKSLIAYITVFALILTAVGIHLINNDEVTSTSADAGVNVPIIMYHSVLKNSKKLGKFVISPDQFEQDLKYIKENGYETVTMNEVIAYVNGNGSLPKKPIVLTFDDGYYNNFLYIYPLLKKYNCKAVISIVGAYTDLYTQTPDENAEYSHLSWDNVNELMESGLVEFQNHSYNMHSTDKGRNGSKKKFGESLANYEKALTDDLTLLQNEFVEHTGYTPLVFTYPFGSVSKASYDIIKKIGFKASLSCENKTNYIVKGDKNCLFMLNRFIRTNAKPLSAILKKGL